MTGMKADIERSRVSLDAGSGGSPVPLTCFLLAGLMWPFVVMQSSQSVFTLVLGVSPRGAAARVGVPWTEFITIGMSVAAAGGFLLLLTIWSRRFGVGWVVPTIVALTNVVGALIAGVLVSARADVYQDASATGQWVAANNASENALLLGALLGIAVSLFAPLAGRARRSRLGLTESAFVVVVIAAAAYGIAPTLSALVRFG